MYIACAHISCVHAMSSIHGIQASLAVAPGHHHHHPLALDWVNVCHHCHYRSLEILDLLGSYHHLDWFENPLHVQWDLAYRCHGALAILHSNRFLLPDMVVIFRCRCCLWERSLQFWHYQSYTFLHILVPSAQMNPILLVRHHQLVDHCFWRKGFVSIDQ